MNAIDTAGQNQTWKGISMNTGNQQSGMMASGYGAIQEPRPVTRLESERNWLRECVAMQDTINDRLRALANGLCGGHPVSGEANRGPDVPRAVPSGLTEELHEAISEMKTHQDHTLALIGRLSEAIPEVR